MKMMYTCVCLFLISLHVSAQRPIQSKADRQLEQHKTKDKMEKKESIENARNAKDESVSLPGKQENGSTIRDMVFILWIALSILLGVFLVYFLVRMLLSCISKALKRLASFSSHTGETDKLLNGKKICVNFHRTLDATLSTLEVHQLSEMMKSVGIFYCNNLPQGTVIRIGQNFILTAWHVIEPIVSNPGQIDTNGGPMTSMDLQRLKRKDVIYVGFNKNAKTKEQDFRCGLLPKLCFLDRAKDVCILELDCDSALLPEPFKVFRDFRDMWDGHPQSKFVHVIGQHQNKMTIVADIGCKVKSKEDKMVMKLKKWLKENKNEVVKNGHSQVVEECYDFYFQSQQHLLLDTFLEFGASGAAVVSFTPDGSIALVGVLLKGLPPWYWNEERSERGYPNMIRVEVACQIKNILMSKEWTDSEKRRILGQEDISLDIGEDMETNDFEENAADKKLAALSLND